MTSIVDDEDFDLSVYDLHPSDETREAIDIYMAALDTSYSNLNINDYVSIDREAEDGVYIDEGSFEKDISQMFKPYEELNNKVAEYLLSVIVSDFREKFSLYKTAINKGKMTNPFPMNEWKIKEYEDKYSNQVIGSVLYAAWELDFPESFSIENKLKVLNPFIIRRLKRLNNDMFFSNISKIEKNESFKFLEKDNNFLKSETIPDYVKKNGNVVDHYYYLSGQPYYLKDKIYFLSLRDDPFMENKANFYLKEDSSVSDLNLQSLFNQFLNSNLKSKENLEVFKAFKEIANSLPSLKDAKENPNLKDKTMKVYLNALVSYINEMREVVKLEDKDIEKHGISLIITIEKSFDRDNLSMSDEKAKATDYFEYFLMKVDTLNLEKNNKNVASKTLKKF